MGRTGANGSTDVVTPTASGLTAVETRAWILSFRDLVLANAAELSDLDRQSGDGDFGTNITSVLDVVEARLETGESSVAAHFSTLSSGFMSGGGTSGPLFGMWFRGFAEASSVTGPTTSQELAVGAEQGLAAVTRLGGAKVGDKTMVDAMSPAVIALRSAADRRLPARLALADAALAARTGASITASYVARRGRASYVGAAAQGVVDPGALAVALFFESVPAVDNEGSDGTG